MPGGSTALGGLKHHLYGGTVIILQEDPDHVCTFATLAAECNYPTYKAMYLMVAMASRTQAVTALARKPDKHFPSKTSP